MKAETSNMHKLNSNMKLPSKDKEPTCSSKYIAYSWVSTKVDHTVPIDNEPTKTEFENMGKYQRRNYCKNREGVLNEISK